MNYIEKYGTLKLQKIKITPEFVDMFIRLKNNIINIKNISNKLPDDAKVVDCYVTGAGCYQDECVAGCAIINLIYTSKEFDDIIEGGDIPFHSPITFERDFD